MQEDDGSSRASQVVTAAGPSGSERDIGNQSVQVSRCCGIADAQERSSSDQQKGQQPLWLDATIDQEQQVMKTKQQMHTPVAAKTPHAR